jgi:hypothetical protein
MLRKDEEKKLNPLQLKELTEARLAEVRDCVRKHRQRLKECALEENKNIGTGESGYSSANIFGKAAKKN